MINRIGLGGALVIILLSNLSAIAQNMVNTVSISVLADSMRVKSKPVFLLLSTDWCKYCSMQKAQLRKNKDFRDAMEEFYYVEFNAETKDSISFDGKMYRYKSNGATTGVHELAEILGSTKEGLSYPTWVLIDKKYQILLKHKGVLAPNELKIVLNAIREMNHQSKFN